MEPRVVHTIDSQSTACHATLDFLIKNMTFLNDLGNHSKDVVPCRIVTFGNNGRTWTANVTRTCIRVRFQLLYSVEKRRW